jgi:hypothetical protein
VQQKKVLPNGYSLVSSLSTRLAYLGRGWIFSSSTNLFITTFFSSQFKPCEVFLISIHFFHLEEPTLEAVTRSMGTSTFTNVKVVLITYIIAFVVVIVIDIFVWWIHDTFPFYIMPHMQNI